MGYLPQDSVLFTSSTFGRAGPHVFFVISGFVIPYALQAYGYKVRDYGRFLLKRLIRLDPPYIAAICVTMLIAAYHSWADTERFPYSLPQLLVHLGYANVFFRYEWLNPVFWTLGVEVQYYLAIGLVFPIFKHPKIVWLIVAPACIVVANHNLKPAAYIFPWLPFFLMGIAAYHYRRGMLNRWLFFAALVLPTLFALVWGSWRVALASVSTAIIIATVSRPMPRLLVGLGTISYSLYLIHWPVGVTVGNAIRRAIPTTPPIVIVLITLTACLLVAWVFYRLVELPSVRFSKRIRYRVAADIQPAPAPAASPA